MSDEQPGVRKILPVITEDHLKDHAVILLVESAKMHALAREKCATEAEYIDLLTRSMQEAFHNGYKVASHAEGALTPDQEMDISEGMYSIILTIGAAALSLAPLYEAALAAARQRRIITLN